VLLAAVPRVSEAAPLPPARAGAAEGDLQAVRVLLEQKVARERLAALGLSPDEVRGLLDRLTPEERSELAARAEELGTGGDVVGIIAVAIILTMVVILVLELMGRRVISRP
jgi:hypothetical protein